MVKAHHNSKHREGPIARQIEEETAKIPSDVFLWAAGAAAGTSLLLRMMGRQSTSTLLGQWVPTILICGVYNKLVKTHGHDAEDQGDEDAATHRRNAKTGSES